MKKIVTIKCYGDEEKMERKKAIEKFAECIYYSDGSEKCRYANVLADLVTGKDYCWDGEE